MSDSNLPLVGCPHCHTLIRLPQDRLDQHPNCGRCGAPVFAGKPFALDRETLAVHAARSELPLLVDFWAPWCGPCRMMGPAFEQAAAKLEPWLHLAKVDTEAHPQLAVSSASAASRPWCCSTRAANWHASRARCTWAGSCQRLGDLVQPVPGRVPAPAAAAARARGGRVRAGAGLGRLRQPVAESD